jgi:hypothetical protein
LTKRMYLVLVLVVALRLAVGAGEKRYVVPSKDLPAGYALWTNRQWADSCAKATIRGTKTDQQTFCVDGFSGLKPKVGSLPGGAEVELLDSTECGRMAYVRVLTGELKGEVGCIVAAALSSFKPE